MILSSPLLVTFAQTKALALPPSPSTTSFPWLVANYFHDIGHMWSHRSMLWGKRDDTLAAPQGTLIGGWGL